MKVYRIRLYDDSVRTPLHRIPKTHLEECIRDTPHFKEEFQKQYDRKERLHELFDLYDMKIIATEYFESENDIEFFKDVAFAIEYATDFRVEILELPVMKLNRAKKAIAAAAYQKPQYVYEQPSVKMP
jgi:hypothetical protein